MKIFKIGSLENTKIAGRFQNLLVKVQKNSRINIVYHPLNCKGRGASLKNKSLTKIWNLVGSGFLELHSPHVTWNNYCPPKIIIVSTSLTGFISPTQLYSIIYFESFSILFGPSIFNHLMQHVSWGLLYVLCDVLSSAGFHCVLCDVLFWKIKY